MKNKSLLRNIINETIFIFLTALGIFYWIALISHSELENTFSSGVRLPAEAHNLAGIVGAYLSDVLLSVFGWSAYLLPIAFIWLGWNFHRKKNSFGYLSGSIRSFAFLTMLLATMALFQILPEPSGGWVGLGLDAWLSPLLGPMRYIWYGVLIIIGYSIASTHSWKELFANLKLAFNKLKSKKESESPRPIVKKPSQEHFLPKARRKTKKKKPVLKKFTQPINDNLLPSLSFLNEPSKIKVGYSTEELNAMGQRVVNILADFGFEITISEINLGPVVTQFEVSLAPGVKVSQIINLSKDLARALLVDSVRIVDVIPGKPVIGIEIPNSQREMITLQEILASNEFQQSNSKLTMALGKNINGKPIIANLAKMPHLLVAGATGMGKSVGLNAMIISILYKATPKEVRLIMIDPKIVELAIYADIPHLLTPVVTDMNEAASALWWCVNEMERRYALLAKLGVRNLDGFNEKIRIAQEKGEPILDPNFNEATAEENESAPELEPLPLIMLVIDEYADMLGALAQDDRSKSKRVEGFIIRLAQKARAAGIHLIIATQRPSVDVITGLIKSNIPTRIAFKVSSKVDSRTIVDQGGAEQLLGLGDMLYMTPGLSAITRVHGAFVDDDEINRVVNFLKANYETNYQQNILNQTEEQAEDSSNTQTNTSGELDSLYDEAVEIVTTSRRASISSLQRRLRIGYNRSARIIEDMEASGVVSTMNSAGTRQVLAPEPIQND
jgi:S-DNA-T family DNA segregation ATPase FtsK/SpoIIIE